MAHLVSEITKWAGMAFTYGSIFLTMVTMMYGIGALLFGKKPSAEELERAEYRSSSWPTSHED